MKKVINEEFVRLNLDALNDFCKSEMTLDDNDQARELLDDNYIILLI